MRYIAKISFVGLASNKRVERNIKTNNPNLFRGWMNQYLKDTHGLDTKIEYLSPTVLREFKIPKKIRHMMSSELLSQNY